MGPPSDSVNRCLEKVAEFDWVYGRYNEWRLMVVIMAYKPTNINGGPHPARLEVQFH